MAEEIKEEVKAPAKKAVAKTEKKEEGMTPEKWDKFLQTEVAFANTAGLTKNIREHVKRVQEAVQQGKAGK